MQNTVDDPPILVVDDSPISQQVACAMLERLGYRAVAVSSGREALTALAQKTYRAVLMDCQMPDMDGLATTIAIRRQLGREQYLPIIAATANSEEDIRGACLAAGMDDVMEKPLQLKTLAAMLGQWVGSGHR